MAIHRLNHAVLYVRDAARSAQFFVDVLGFERLGAYDMIPGAVFLRAGGSTNDHDLGLFSIGPDAGPSQAGAGRVGLYHLAWEVDTLADLARYAEALSAAGALVGATDHGTTKALYAKDPDGIEFEVSWLVPRHLITPDISPTTRAPSTSRARSSASAPTPSAGSASHVPRPPDVGAAIRIDDDGAVRRLVLCRAAEMNTITPQLRDELDDALDAADRDSSVRVVLLTAEGRAFCAGFGLDWSTAAQAQADAGSAAGRVWDTVADVQMIGRFGNTFAKLHTISKPTLAAVQGWCVAGGTDMVLNADLIVAGESARFGYPPARVWGVPEAPWVWVARLGLERAKRYLFTGDELTASEAAAVGMILECVPDGELEERAVALAKRIALLPLNQLQMMKWMLNDVARHQYQPDTSRLLGFIFDGVARHTQEGLDWVARAQEIGFREAVRERDRPFGDYGERPR